MDQRRGCGIGRTQQPRVYAVEISYPRGASGVKIWGGESNRNEM